MSNKLLEVISIALNHLNPTAKTLIIVPENEFSKQDNSRLICLENNFDVKNTIALIGDVKYIGIVDSEKFKASSVTELINILITTNKATVVRVSTSPISCKVFHPIPEIGTKHSYGNYEYSYGQMFSMRWKDVVGQNGWGVRIIDKTESDYESPLTILHGYLVTNLSYLFHSTMVETLNLINWNTSNVTTMYKMFEWCEATTISGLNNFTTLAATNMYSMFANSFMKNLDLSSFNTSNVTNMKRMFSNSRVTSLDLSNFDTSNITNMEAMFTCIRAKTLDLSSFDTSKVTKMSGMFYSCDSTTLNLSSFDTSNVTDMSLMFSGSRATSLDLSSFDTSMVTDMSQMFSRSQVSNLDLRSFDTSKATNMSYMFCDSKAIILDLSNFNTSNVTDMCSMFDGSETMSLDLSSFDTSKVTNMDYLFRDSQVTTLDLSSFDTSSAVCIDDMFNYDLLLSLKARTQADADKYCQSSDGNVLILLD